MESSPTKVLPDDHKGDAPVTNCSHCRVTDAANRFVNHAAVGMASCAQFVMIGIKV